MTRSTRSQRTETEPPAQPEAPPSSELATTGTDIAPREGWDPTQLKARFPADLRDPRLFREFLLLCRATGLNPFMLEVIPMHGRAYITEQGWMRLIDSRAPGQLVYDEARLCTEEEYAQFGARGGWLAVAVVRRYMPEHGQTREVRDYGFVTQAAVRASKVSVVKDEPWRMAMKTARVRALRKAFPEVLYKATEGNLIEMEVVPEDYIDINPNAEEDKEVEVTMRSRFWKEARTEWGTLRDALLALPAVFDCPVPDKQRDFNVWVANEEMSWSDICDKLDRYRHPEYYADMESGDEGEE